MHEITFEQSERKYLRISGAFPAYYHIKYVYRKNPCGHFNYVWLGEGNNVENVCQNGQCGNGTCRRIKF